MITLLLIGFVVVGVVTWRAVSGLLRGIPASNEDFSLCFSEEQADNAAPAGKRLPWSAYYFGAEPVKNDVGGRPQRLASDPL